jgi:hypothetical protein
MDGSPHEEKDLIEAFRAYTKLNRGAFPNSLDHPTVTWTFWKAFNIQTMWDNIIFSPLIGNVNEQERRQYEEQIGKIMDQMHDKAIEGKASKEQTGKFAEQMSTITRKIVIQQLWENLAPAKWKADEERRHKFEKRMLTITNGTPEQERKAQEEINDFMIEGLWEELAPAKWKNNEQQRR